MILEPTLAQMSIHDIHATYSGTYLRFNTPDDDGWWTGYVDSATRDRDKSYLVVTKGPNESRCISLGDSRVKLSLEYPKLGNINQKKHSWYIDRRAVRQWKKGLRLSLLRTRVNGNCMLEHLRPYGYSLDNEAIDEIYEPTYTNYFEAVEGVYHGDFISRAISPEFAIANLASLSKPVLMYKGRAVGTYEDTTLSIHEDLSHIEPMIRRIVPDGYNNSIVIQP